MSTWLRAWTRSCRSGARTLPPSRSCSSPAALLATLRSACLGSASRRRTWRASARTSSPRCRSTCVLLVRFDWAHTVLCVGRVQKASSDGVDCSRIKYNDGPTGTCIVLSGPKDRAFVSCLGANRFLTTEYLRSALPRVAVGSFVHIGGEEDERGVYHSRAVVCPALTGARSSCRLLHDARAAHGRPR